MGTFFRDCQPPMHRSSRGSSCVTLLFLVLIVLLFMPHNTFVLATSRKLLDLDWNPIQQDDDSQGEFPIPGENRVPNGKTDLAEDKAYVQQEQHEDWKQQNPHCCRVDAFRAESAPVDQLGKECFDQRSGPDLPPRKK